MWEGRLMTAADFAPPPKSGAASKPPSIPASHASASGQVSFPDEDVCRDGHPDGSTCTKRHSVPQSIEPYDALFEMSDDGLLPSSEMAPISEYYPSTVQREFTSAETPVARSGTTQSQISGPIRRPHCGKARSSLQKPNDCFLCCRSGISYHRQRMRHTLRFQARTSTCADRNVRVKLACNTRALVSSFLNVSVAPCEDFYTHVCGSWRSDLGKLGVSDTALTTYQRRLSRQAFLQSVPASGSNARAKGDKNVHGLLQCRRQEG
ncbi:hypothetical protein MRX96_029161 [Rhipicephalus microplus]